MRLILLVALLALAPVAAQAADPAPTIFAPGVISGAANDGAPTFMPDGRTIFFERTNGAWTAIVTSSLAAGRWSKPVLAPFASAYSDQQPALSPDGRFVVFESTRPDPAATGDKPRTLAHLYRAEFQGGRWSEAKPLPETVNFSRRVFKPSVARNGDLYFMADTGPAGPPAWRLFVSRWADGAYRKAEPLRFSDGQYGDVDPYVAPDQSYLIFSSKDRPPFKDGHEHLFLVTRQADGWSAPRPLRYAGDEPGADDGEAQVSPDGKTLYFTSGRTLPAPPTPRTRAAVAEALDRMQSWDNSNSNVWTLPLAPYLAAADAGR
ncbi:MAG: PD40 domain-containing protein [Caulobacterales bacterium]|nr:PD40 domain-containing protein [Caulobacterales bacterium]